MDIKEKNKDICRVLGRVCFALFLLMMLWSRGANKEIQEVTHYKATYTHAKENMKGNLERVVEEYVTIQTEEQWLRSKGSIHLSEDTRLQLHGGKYAGFNKLELEAYRIKESKYTIEDGDTYKVFVVVGVKSKGESKDIMFMFNVKDKKATSVTVY